jgi:chaperonin GroEL
MIKFGDEVKQKLLQGINLVADTVRPTLGPQARTAILQGNPPIVINDGVTIAKHVSHDDPYIQMGVQLVQSLALKAQSKAGDGTTTACVLAQALCNHIMALNISNIHRFKEELETTRDAMLEVLDELAIPVEGVEKILEVATIAANNDPVLGQLIADVFSFVGKDGVISVEEGHGLTTEYELKQGLELENGYLSHLFANQDNGECVLEKPLILTTNKAIINFADLLPALEYASSQSSPLLIICSDLQGSALSNVLANVVQGRIQVGVCRAPNHGDARLDELKDVISVVGGKLFSNEAKDDLKIVDASCFGSCDKVVLNQVDTTIVGGGGDVDAIQDRVDSLTELYKIANNDWIRERLTTRIARLKGGVAVIRVGGGSSVELRETKERLDDALNATKAALQEGVIVGGGLGLLVAWAELNRRDMDLNPLYSDVFMTPIDVLIKNADGRSHLWDRIEPDSVIGFNAKSRKIENLWEAGVIDPVKVTKSSLSAAFSIALMFLTTEVAVLLEE